MRLLLVLLVVLVWNAALVASTTRRAKTSRSDREYRRNDTACRRTCEYQSEWVSSAESMNCWRRCLSPACYEEIYAADPLERGEIDTRATAFRKCFTQESTRRWQLAKGLDRQRPESEQSESDDEPPILNGDSEDLDLTEEEEDNDDSDE